MSPQELFNENTKLVHHLIHTKFRGYLSHTLEYEDLYQIGCMGLYQAAESFDESRGVKFSTYAIRVIMNELLMAVKRRRPTEVSLDNYVDEDENISFLDTEVISKEDIYFEPETSLKYLAKVRLFLKPKDFALLYLRHVKQVPWRDLEQYFNTDRSKLVRKITRIRLKLKRLRHKGKL